MLFDIKYWKNKTNLKEFNNIKKEVLRLVNLKKNNKKLYDFNFLYQDKQSLKKNISKVHRLFPDYDNFILIGTGGSSLGSKAILDASSKNNIIFLENIDPNYILKKVSKIKKKKILLLIISKSGETIEVLSLYQIIINNFSNLFNFKKDVLVITEKKNSHLYRICREKNFKFLEHDSKIGGRFSCFSETGLMPLKLAGLNTSYIKDLSDKTFHQIINNNKYLFSDNVSSLFNIIKKAKYKCHVVLSYQESLKYLIQWYRQLWSESLGKKGKGIHLMPALGSVDQHSQLQIWLDGPDNIFYTIILPKRRSSNFILKDRNKLIPSYLNNMKVGDILNTMGKSIYNELVKANRPVRLIYLDDDGLYPTIKLMSFLMLEVAMLGKLDGINPFDQPAVEKSKLSTKKLLNKNE